MPSMLERFREAKREEIACLHRREAENGSVSTAVRTERRPSLASSLKAERGDGFSAIVAEYKRASPSKGNINLSLLPEDAARFYSEAGAAAISVLTESRYFGGDTAFLERMNSVGLPLLRKDFIFHPLQVYATVPTSASAILVIVRMLDDAELAEVLAACRSGGLEPVCEIFSREDLKRLRDCGGAEIVQVNNRDLDTLETNLGLSRELIGEKGEGEVWISASGYKERSQIEEMESLGFDAFLIGTSLMGDGDPASALAGLRGAV